MKKGEEGVSLARERALRREGVVKRPLGLCLAAAKTPVHFPLAGLPQMAGDQHPLLPKQELVAEPDQLAGPLRTGEVGDWDSTIWPHSQKNSWAGGAERELWVTWPRSEKWGPRSLM